MQLAPFNVCLMRCFGGSFYWSSLKSQSVLKGHISHIGEQGNWLEAARGFAAVSSLLSSRTERNKSICMTPGRESSVFPHLHSTMDIMYLDMRKKDGN